MPELPIAGAEPFRAENVRLPPPEDPGGDLGAIAKDALARSRETLRVWNEAGAGGGEIVAAYTSVVDRIVRWLYEAAVADFGRRNVRVNQRCAVLAEGGYGRAELNPGSDVDLLFLYHWKVNPFVESVAEKILYTLWDTGLRVGHSVRSVPECVRLAARDLKVKTALLDTRFLCGDLVLFGEFDRAMKRDILPKNQDRFFQDKIAESEARHESYGGSVYLLEPQIKEGEGGLRDLHTALWMARVKYKIENLRQLVQKGVVNERELAGVLEARDFLWRVRNTLHFLSNGHQDQLTFEYQERVAAILGYRDRDERRAVEAFLQDVYTHADRVHRFAALIQDRCLEKAQPYRRFGRPFGREIRPGVRILDREISIEDPERIEEEPVELIRLYLEAQRHGVSLSSRTRGALQRLAPLLDERRDSPEIVGAFLEILRGPSRVVETLREMHASGVLGHLVPEFGALYRTVIRDLHHIYTVDEHTLRGVAELERLHQGHYRESCPLLTQVIHQIDRLEVLYLAMLLHDVGKGHGQGHSERGAHLALAAAARMGLHPDDARQIADLVRHHLLMSHIAQRRDLQDDRVIVEFARQIGSIEVLNKLYVMTFADMRSVAPTVWNNWRDLELGELYMRALEVLEQGEFVAEEPEARAERVKQRLREELGVREPALAGPLEDMLTTMPASYFLTTPGERFAHHVRLLRDFRRDTPTLLASVRHFPEREFSEFTVCTRDRPGLFSMIAGALAAQRINILGAVITTSEDGVALDVFRVSHGPHGRVLEDERWQRVRESLEKVISGEIDVGQLVARSRRGALLEKKVLPSIASEVTVDNEDSERYTLFEISTRDEIGLLYTITQGIRALGCRIHIAKISTVLDHVYDVFYVSDLEGRKITDPAKLEEIRAGLEARLAGAGGPPGESVAAASR